MSNFEAVMDNLGVTRVRRNHGLEHATLNVLSDQYPNLRLAGHSDLGGFWIIGDAPTGAVEAAVRQALGRLKGGEKELAIHANCGTNFVAAGAVAGLAAWMGMLGSGRALRQKLERLPLVISLATMALILAQPLGFALQARVTTSGQPGGLELDQVIVSHWGRLPAHRVLTRG
jgi:hypothetical protein